MISSYLLVCIVVSVVHLCIGTSVFIRAPRKRTNQTLYLTTISVVGWMLFTTASSMDWEQLELRAVLTRFAYAVGMLTSASIASFCVVFSNKGNMPRRTISLIASIFFVFVTLSFYPGAILKGFVRTEAGVIELHGLFRLPFYLATVVILSAGFWHIWKRYREAEFDEEKYQLRLLGAGIFIPAVTSIVSLVALPLFVGNSPLQMSIGPISTVVFILLAGYATLKQGRFVEVDLALGHVFESISAGICVTQINRRIVRHNLRLVEMLDYPGKLTGQSLDYLADFLKPNMEQSDLILRGWLDKEQPEPIEIILSGLRNKTIELSASPLEDFKGRTLGKVILFHDVTERKLLKEEIRSSEEKYRTLVESADDIIYTVDPEGNFTFFNNRASEKISGYKVEDWFGKNFRDVILPGEDALIVEHANDAYEGRPQRFETEIYHKSGKIITLSNCLSPIVKDGAVVGYSGVARDITETKELEQQLKESEEKYRTLVEESENVVYIIQDGRLRFVNRHGLGIAGYTEEDLCREDFDLLQLIHPDDHLSVAETMAVLVDRPHEYRRLEARFVSKHGDTYDFIMSAASMTYQGMPAIMGVLVDITEKKKMQEQLIQSEKLASIGQLVSGVAHELNNPLAAIMGYAQLFSENSELPPKVREAAGKMVKSSERCKRIIQNLLSFARQQEIEKVSVDVNDILDKAIELREYNLRSHRIEVNRDYQQDLKTAMGDPHHLQSAFLNLINNASDAMRGANGNGVLIVKTRMQGAKIVVEFIDNGPGIPPRFRDKVFDPFFTTKEVGQGTGLGLSISYGIIQEHGGELVLDRSYTGGSKFMIKLPAAGDPVEEKPAADPPAERPATGGKPRILVVDDEEMILDLSVDILSGQGYDVETASTGEIARDMLEVDHFDLVIADIRMPGALSGIDLFHWAKRNMSGLESRIVFATGDMVADETQQFLSETKRPCLSKPFEMSEYLDTVQTALAAGSRKAN